MKAKDEFNHHRHRQQNCALFIPKVQEAWMRRSIDVLLGIQGNIIRYLKVCHRRAKSLQCMEYFFF
jgi:hypothetical protein